jgi:hypothetical protein
VAKLFGPSGKNLGEHTTLLEFVIRSHLAHVVRTNMVGQSSWGWIRRIGCPLEIRIIIGGDYMDEELQG